MSLWLKGTVMKWSGWQADESRASDSVCAQSERQIESDFRLKSQFCRRRKSQNKTMTAVDLVAGGVIQRTSSK